MTAADRWADEARRVVLGGWPEELRALLEELPPGAGVDGRDETGRTLLMHAAWNGRVGQAELLLAAGADPLLRDLHGDSAFSAGERGVRGEKETLALASLFDAWGRGAGRGREALPHPYEVRVRPDGSAAVPDGAASQVAESADGVLRREVGFVVFWYAGQPAGRIWLLPDEDERAQASFPLAEMRGLALHMTRG